MGDRANIYMVNHPHKKPENGFFIYTHFGGYCLPRMLQAALKRGRDRWKDEPYLGRIIFSEVAKDAGIDCTTGCGLSTYFTDNEHNVLVVDSEKQIVGVTKPPDSLGEGEFPKLFREVSFSAYVEMTEEQLEKFREEP